MRRMIPVSYTPLEIPAAAENEIYVSAEHGTNIYELKEKIGALAGKLENKKSLIGDLIEPNDIVVLVTPIDESAPKGRMILPQQQMIRDVLDHGAINVVVKETELEKALSSLSQKPKMVITDSQALDVYKRQHIVYLTLAFSRAMIYNIIDLYSGYRHRSYNNPAK